MSRYSAMRVFAFVNLFFAIITSVTVLENHWIESLIIICLCTASAFVGGLLENKRLEFVGLVFLIPVIILGIVYKLYIHAFVPAAYVAILMFSGKLRVYYYELKTTMQIAFGVLIFFIAFNFLGRLYYYDTVFYGALFMVSGVILLRELRLGNGLDTKGKLLNLGEVVGCIGAGAFLGIALNLLVKYSASIFIWIFYPIGVLISLLTDLVVFVKETFFPNTMIADVMYVEPKEDMPIEALERDDLVEAVMANSEKEVDFWATVFTVLYVVAIVVIIAIVVYFIIRFIRHVEDKKNNNLEISDTRDKVIIWKRKRKREKEKTNVQKIRSIYKKYLVLLNKKGVGIADANTSLDILEKADSVNKNDASVRLRELYIRARYQNEEAILESDVEEAKRLLKQITELMEQN